MNTPTHAVVNLALLERKYPAWPVFIGAVFPDIPIYLFFLYERYILNAAHRQIWSVDYFHSAWQPVIDAFHSFPLILLAIGVARYFKKVRWEGFSASLLLHSLLAFPFHHDDVHRHFFPFSQYRFQSPISYWDVRHYGAIGAFGELALVLIGSGILMRRHPTPWPRISLGALCAFYVVSYYFLYIH